MAGEAIPRQYRLDITIEANFSGLTLTQQGWKQ